MRNSIKDYLVITNFVPIDDSLGKRNPPLLFETTIFDEDQNPEIWNKYSTYQDAQEGHLSACDLIRNRFTLAK